MLSCSWIRETQTDKIAESRINRALQSKFLIFDYHPIGAFCPPARRDVDLSEPIVGEVPCEDFPSWKTVHRTVFQFIPFSGLLDRVFRSLRRASQEGLLRKSPSRHPPKTNFILWAVSRIQVYIQRFPKYRLLLIKSSFEKITYRKKSRILLLH